LKRKIQLRHELKPQFFQRVLRSRCSPSATPYRLPHARQFMTEQQGRDWRDVGPMLDAADADFKKARMWLGKRVKEDAMPDRLWGAVTAAAIAATIEFAKVIADEFSKRRNRKNRDVKRRVLCIRPPTSFPLAIRGRDT